MCCVFSARRGVTTLCAPPTVWRMLIQEKLADYPVRLREAASAGEPLNPEVIEQVRAAWGLTVRDGYGQTETTAYDRQLAGTGGETGIGGQTLARVPDRLSDAGEICVDREMRPAGLMLGYVGQAGQTGELAYGTGDIAQRRMRTAT